MLQSVTTSEFDSCNERQTPGIYIHYKDNTLNSLNYFIVCLYLKGFICSTCNILSKCLFRNNGWDTIGLEVCPDGLFCNVNEGKCSSSPGPCNNGNVRGGVFACTSAGNLI